MTQNLKSTVLEKHDARSDALRARVLDMEKALASTPADAQILSAFASLKDAAKAVYAPEYFQLPSKNDPDFVKVQIESDPEEYGALGEIAVDGDGAEFTLKDVEGRSVITRFEVNYPRAKAYGVPDCATDEGAEEFLRSITTLGLSQALEVDANDTRDDTPMTFSIEVLVHRDCLVPVPQEVCRER